MPGERFARITHSKGAMSLAIRFVGSYTGPSAKLKGKSGVIHGPWRHIISPSDPNPVKPPPHEIKITKNHPSLESRNRYRRVRSDYPWRPAPWPDHAAGRRPRIRQNHLRPRLSHVWSARVQRAGHLCRL